MSCPASIHWRAESFRSTKGEPMAVRRALALNAVLERCRLPVAPGALLVGVGNPGRYLPTGAIEPATIESDRRYLETRIGSRNFGVHADHHAPDYATLLEAGFAGLRKKVQTSLPCQDATGRIFLESVRHALDGAASHLLRWSRTLGESRAWPEHEPLMRQQAERLERLATDRPESFADALQLVLLYHCMLQLDDRAAMAFGRMDQYLYPFYVADIESGRITAEAAQTLLDELFTRITVDEDVQNITLAGVRAEDGADAVNQLSYMILEACRRIGRPGGNCTARIHSGTPGAFVEACAQVIRTGIGYPAVYNDEIAIDALTAQGYPIEHARDYCFVGCIEVFLQGRQAPWADARLNPAAALNLTVFDSEDPSHDTTGREEHDAAHAFNRFYTRFLTRCHDDLHRRIVEWNELQSRYDDHAMDYTSPLMSALTADCIRRGRDVNDGGALYPGNCGFGIMGIATIADSLAVLKSLVFDQRSFTMERMRAMLEANFGGYEPELRRIQATVPRFGNDEHSVDALAARFVQDYAGLFERYRTPRGGRYWPLMASNTANVQAGAQLGATPDGRREGVPVSDACSPSFGRDVNGPTAAVRSIAKLPYRRCPGGNVVNMKLDPVSLRGRTGIRALAALIRGAFDLGASELQFNTTDRSTLEDAMRHPERHENLVVRVSGFSARFTRLERAVQLDILARTEHGLAGG